MSFEDRDDIIVKLVEKIKYLDFKQRSHEKELSLFKQSINNITSLNVDLNDASKSGADLSSKQEISDKKNKSLFGKIKKRFFLWMSMSGWGGIQNIYRAKYLFQKIAWIIVFLLFAAATWYVVGNQIKSYLGFGEVTAIQLTQDLPAQFPTITICNQNPFYLSNLISESHLKLFNNYSEYINSCHFNDAVNGLNSTNEFIRFQKLSATVKTAEFTKMFQRALLNGYGSLIYAFQDKILSCKFLGIPCDIPNDFSVYPNMEYLYCFKYNGLSSNIKSIGKAGPSNGLQFSFYLGEKSSEVFTKRRGLRIYIHNITETFPTQFIDIQPGVEANIGIKRTFYQRLSQPYTNCIDDLTSQNNHQTVIMKYMFNVLNVNHYSYDLCEASVFTKLLNQTCDCVDKSYTIYNSNQICHTSSQIDCLNNFRSLFAVSYTNYIMENCPIECFKIDYDKEISYSEHLTDWYVQYIKNSIKPYLNNLNESTINPQINTLNQVYPQNATTDEIRKNIVTFNIYYNDLSYKLLTGVPQFDWFTLLANICGVFGGSFLGISLISVVEFFETILISFGIIVIGCYKKLRIDKKIDMS